MNYQKILSQTGVDSLVFMTDGSCADANFYYFTGLSKASHVSSTVVVNRNGPTIITNRLESDIFRGRKIVIENREQAEQAVRKLCGKRIGVDYSMLSFRRMLHFRKMLKGRKFIDVSEKMGGIRATKSASEIKKIKQACKIAEEVLGMLDKLAAQSRNEKELAAELSHAARRNGAESTAFPSIVAAGKNSAIPHHVPGKSKLKGLLLVDFGVVHDGYCSDITRMFYFGKADSKTKRVYEIVYSAQQAAIAAARGGAKASGVHAAADKVLRQLGQKMIHSAGHGLGIDVHEFPAVSEKSTATLAKGNIITIEPGYYKRGWGGVRIEDDLLVSKKPILLSKAPSSITEI